MNDFKLTCILILFEDFEFVETPIAMGGCLVWWVGDFIS